MNPETIERILSNRPHSPLFARSAAELLASGRIAQAHDLLVDGLAVYPGYYTAQVLLARCLAAEGLYADAVAALEYAEPFAPDKRLLLKYTGEWRGFLPPPPQTETETAEPPATAGPSPSDVESVLPEQTLPEPSHVEPEAAVLPEAEPAEIVTPPAGELISEDFSPGVEVLPAAEQEVPERPREEVLPKAEAGFDSVIHDAPGDAPYSLEDTLNYLEVEELSGEDETELPGETFGEAAETGVTEDDRGFAPERPPEEEFALPGPEQADQAVQQIPPPDENATLLPAIVSEPIADVSAETASPEVIALPPVTDEQDVVPEEHPEAPVGMNAGPVPAVIEPVFSETPAPVDSADQAPTEISPGPAPEAAPGLRVPAAEVPLPDDEHRIVSRTLAEIYASQGAFEEAIITYQLLKKSRPAERSEIDQRIGELALQLRDKLTS